VIRPAALDAFLATGPAVLVEIVGARGSTPREVGAFMLVSDAVTLGTIGGGQLEFMAIDQARQLLKRSAAAATMDVPLGPEIGQCCGGRVDVALTPVDAGTAESLRARAAAKAEARPHVYLFGAGHVGKALAAALSLLPLRPIVVETRKTELAGLPESVERRLVALPEAIIRDAPPGSAYVVLTHDHALDFLIAREALARADACYVGMIGSRTKRARFESWYRQECRSEGGGEGDVRTALARLVSPIGGTRVPDKRPEIIAALTAAELLRHIGPEASPAGPVPASREAAGTAP